MCQAPFPGTVLVAFRPLKADQLSQTSVKDHKYWPLFKTQSKTIAECLLKVLKLRAMCVSSPVKTRFVTNSSFVHLPVVRKGGKENQSLIYQYANTCTFWLMVLAVFCTMAKVHQISSTHDLYVFLSGFTKDLEIKRQTYWLKSVLPECCIDLTVSDSIESYTILVRIWQRLNWLVFSVLLHVCLHCLELEQ